MTTRARVKFRLAQGADGEIFFAVDKLDGDLVIPGRLGFVLKEGIGWEEAEGLAYQLRGIDEIWTESG